MATTRLIPLRRLLCHRTATVLRALSAVSRLPSPASLVSPSHARSFSTQHSMSDNNNNNNNNNNNWSNRPPKETILLDGCDFEHWLVVTDPPPPEWTRDQIIDYYIKTLAQVVGSEEEARMKIYSVSTKHYFAFGALIPEDLSHKLKDMEKIRWVLPDSYLDVKNKDYGGEPFIDGQAVPYDPKYHEEWVRNNQNAQNRNSRNERTRVNDRSRTIERRQRTSEGNMGGATNQHGGPSNNVGRGQNMASQNGGYQQITPSNNTGYQQRAPPINTGYQQRVPPNNTGYQQNMPPNNAAYQQNMPPNNAAYQQNMPPNNAAYQQTVPPNNAAYQQNMPPNNVGYGQNTPQNNMNGNFGGQGQGNPGYNNTAPNYQAGGGMPYPNNPQMGGQQNVPGRDMP